MTAYVPDAGDLVWLTFDPQAGREQGGRRPALVLSPRVYNASVQLMVACPITSRGKGYPFEVHIGGSLPVTGVILTDQIRSMDWKQRRAEFAGHALDDVLTAVRERLRPLLGM